MNKDEKILDDLVKIKLEGIKAEIAKKIGGVCQQYIDRGLYGSTVCVDKQLEVYYEKAKEFIDEVINSSQELGLKVNWDFFEKRMGKCINQIYAKAESMACSHLVNSGLSTIIDTYRKGIKKQKKKRLW